MKKDLLIAAALACVLSTGAQTSYERIATPVRGAVKQLNTRPHFQKPAVSASQELQPMAEVPANAVEVPFSHAMGKNSPSKDTVDKYTYIDANGDGRTWKIAKVSNYTSCMLPNTDGVTAADDWLFTVPVHMSAGKYTLSINLGYMGTGATGIKLEVKLGNAPTVEGMTTAIVPVTDFTVKEKTTYEYNVAIPANGYYYIGFHNVTTLEQKGVVKLFDVGVKAGEVVKVDPPAAGELKWTLAPKGELKATVTYTPPTKTKSGADLTEITKVEITSRWGVDKYEFTEVEPGKPIVVDVEMYEGLNNRFTGVAYVGETAGDMVEYKDIYCGPDTPQPPTNIKLVPSADYKSAVLSWDAVGEVGMHGGYVDPANVIYYIFDAFGSYYDPAIAQTDKTSIKFEYPDLVGQDFVAYQVTAGNGDYYSSEAVSDILIIGEPAKLPFTESFTNSRFDNVWLIDPESGAGDRQYCGIVDDEYFASLVDPEDPDAPEPLKSHDGDNGFYYWLPYEKDVMYGLISVRADISAAANPVLEFWYQGQGSVIDVLVADGGAEFKAVKSIDLQKAPTTGWTLAQVPLSQFKSAGIVQFELKLTAAHNDDEHTWSVPLDNISIRDLVDTDMRVVSLALPETTKPGDKLVVSAHLQNQGTKAVEAVAECYVNGKKVDNTLLGSLQPYAFADAQLEYTVPVDAAEALDVKVLVVAEGDACAANDAVSDSVGVVFPVYPVVTNLTGVAADDGSSVELTWTAPDIDSAKLPKTVDEDFESKDYTPMSISGAGDWTVYDGDKAGTYNVFREYNNPYQTQPIAFQLFNREVADVTTYYEDAAPHSGDSFMLAPSAQSAQNDNWLISPELSGNAQTVTFWAKSFTVAWPESFEVLYSTTGNTVECFTETVAVGNYPADGKVPEVWTKFTVELPAGAKYFAIHHDTNDTLALMVDDVTYEAASLLPADLALTGYLVFRDGEQLTATAVTETSYVDRLATESTADQTSYDYAVVPVYNHGTAKASHAVVNVDTSGIEDVAIDSIGADDMIYNLSGVRVAADDLVPGIYIRVVGSKAAKIAVR